MPKQTILMPEAAQGHCEPDRISGPCRTTLIMDNVSLARVLEVCVRCCTGNFTLCVVERGFLFVCFFVCLFGWGFCLFVCFVSSVRC